MFYSYKSTSNNVLIYRNGVHVATASTYNAAADWVKKDREHRTVNTA